MKRSVVFILTILFVAASAYFFGVTASKLIGHAKTKEWKEKGEQLAKLILDRNYTLRVGNTIPNFFLYDLQGNSIELQKSIKGQRHLLLCYLLSNCSSCREEFDDISQLQSHKEIRNSIIILSHSNPYELLDIVKNYEIKSAILYDHWNQYGIILGIQDYPFNI